MICPYLRDGNFGICVAQDAIHVVSIDEMERFCFKTSYSICPNLGLFNGPAITEPPVMANSRSGEEKSCPQI